MFFASILTMINLGGVCICFYCEKKISKADCLSLRFAKAKRFGLLQYPVTETPIRRVTLALVDSVLEDISKKTRSYNEA